MRCLFSSTAGAGHFGPMVPFIRSALRLGHEVMVAGPAALASSAAATGAGFWPVDDPSHEVMAAGFAALPTKSRDEANTWVISEVFGKLNAVAALPRLRDAMTQWRPDIVYRETAEFGSAVAAEAHGVPQVRVAIGLSAAEDVIVEIASANVDELRRAHGVPGDPGGVRLRETPYLTLFPAGLEDGETGQPHTQRFRDPSWTRARHQGTRPFVYVTFGSVAGSMAHFAAVYTAAIDAVADLDVDVLLTTGQEIDLGVPPPNVRVEQWVDQAEVLSRTSAVLCHGGGGTTLGALAAGVPLVIAPLFSMDQFLNARRVAAVGAGVETLPDAAAIRSALDDVLTRPSYQAKAQELADELAGHPSTDDAVQRVP